MSGRSNASAHFPFQIVRDESKKDPDFVYFITSGEIKIVREVCLKISTTAAGRRKFELARRGEGHEEPDSDNPISVGFRKRSSDSKDAGHDQTEERVDRSESERQHEGETSSSGNEASHRDETAKSTGKPSVVISKRFWSVCTLGPGLYYGVGEQLGNCHLIAKERAEVIQIPRLQFILKRRAADLDKLRENLDDLLPCDEVLFQMFLDDMRWEHYKKQVVNEVVERRKLRTNTAEQDAPRSGADNSQSVYSALVNSL